MTKLPPFEDEAVVLFERPDMTNAKTDLALARQLSELWDENEEVMGEMAAYNVACDQLGIDPDEGWDLLALIGEEIDS